MVLDPPGWMNIQLAIENASAPLAALFPRCSGAVYIVSRRARVINVKRSRADLRVKAEN